MNASLERQGFDFFIRVTELVKYLRENDRGFPLAEQLLTCGIHAGLALRNGKRQEAAELVAQVDYMLEMAVVAGYLTPQQSVHIRADCENLRSVLSEKVKIEVEDELA